MAILSPQLQTLDGLRRLWDLKLADPGSAPFIMVVRAFVGITDTHLHPCIAVLREIRAILLEKESEPGITVHDINPSTREMEIGGSP